MSEQREAIDRAVAAYNDGDLDRYMETYDPSVVLHGYAPEPIDHAGGKAFYSMMRAAFPDAKIALDDALQEGDKVALRFTLKGTHQGDFMGVPATGKPVVITGQSFFQFKGPKIVERWQLVDLLGVMVQIGAVPPPG